MVRHRQDLSEERMSRKRIGRERGYKLQDAVVFRKFTVLSEG